MLNPTSDSNMVAERSISAGTLGEINMIAAGVDPNPPFDPVESERKIKVLVSDQVNAAFEALRDELKGDMPTLNVKFDTVN